MFEDAVEVLKAKDPILREVISSVGLCTLVLESNAFKALAFSIVHQQLSIKAAGTIMKRFMALYPKCIFPAPKDILCTPDGKLRGVGISKQKIKYLKDLSQKFSDRIITTSKFPEMSDEEVVEHLIKVKGIGYWSAKMFLIFSLGRPNVLPIDDLGFQKAVQKHYGIDKFTYEGKLKKLSKKWEPYCTVATWYLWKSLEIMTPKP